jgi:hypothetical protein
VLALLSVQFEMPPSVSTVNTRPIAYQQGRGFTRQASYAIKLYLLYNLALRYFTPIINPSRFCQKYSVASIHFRKQFTCNLSPFDPYGSEDALRKMQSTDGAPSFVLQTTV